MITVCDHNTNQTSYGAHTYVGFLHTCEQNRTDEASKYGLSLPHSSKSVTRNFHLYYATKARAQCPVQISINASRRCDYDTAITKTVSRNSSIVANIPFKYNERSKHFKKTITKRKRDREPPRIPVHKVIKLLKRKKYKSSIQNQLKRNFPSSSFIRDFCSNYKKWFI